MELTFGSRLSHAWNAFMTNKDPTYNYQNIGAGSSYRPDRTVYSRRNDKSIVTSIYNRIAVDAASIPLEHVKLDENKRYESGIESSLNECLRVQANIDQSGRMFVQDAIQSMLDEGCVAVVPVETIKDPTETESYKITQLRTAQIVEWFPKHVRLKLYNERTGKKEDITLPKSMVAIAENPFYSVMNEPNSTLQRLVRKLAILDAIDEQSGSGKLDLIIQLPYSIKSKARQEQAEQRVSSIEAQLSGSKYGIAYIDGTEHVTQLNRAVENNLMGQIQYLTSMLYGQLCIDETVLNGTANAETMTNYMNRTVEPVLAALIDAMIRSFLTKTARTKGHSICAFRDPFKLVPVNAMAEIADKLTRNEIMSSNEIRQGIGMKPSKDPKADELRNKNLSEPKESDPAKTQKLEGEEEIQNGE